MADDTKKEEKKNLDPASKLPAATSLIDEQRKNKIMRQFELQVFDEDLNDDGTTRLKPVKMERAIIVEASTPEELKTILAQYRLCGQVAKIVREINPPPHPISEPTPQAQLPAPQCQSQIMPAASASSSNLPTAPVAAPKLKPKIVTIGDMQVKYDGDKVYQKQWVKLNANEAKQIRVVNDSSNKLINLTGKHIEVLRWTLIEDETQEDPVLTFD